MALALIVVSGQAPRLGTPPSPGTSLQRVCWGDSAAGRGRGGARPRALVAREGSSGDELRVGVWKAPPSLLMRACGSSICGHGRGGARALEERAGTFFYHDDDALFAPMPFLRLAWGVSAGGRGRTRRDTRTHALFAADLASSAEAARRLGAPVGCLRPRVTGDSGPARLSASPMRAPAPLRPAAAVCRCSMSSPLISMEAVSNSWSISDTALLSIELINKNVNSQDVTIVQNILERSQLCLNQDTYSSKASKIHGFPDSLVVYIMQEMEKSHAKAGRYKCPAEIPFFPETLLEPLIPTKYPSVLHMRYTSISLNKEIWQVYFGKILPKLAKTGKDGHNGPSAVCDAKILQGLSKRIHYTMFLAEAKFRKSPDIYESAIKEQDPEKLRNLLRDPKDGDDFKREKQFRTDVCQVLMNSGASVSFNPKLKPEMIVDLFDQFVIPMAIEVQVQYLLLKAYDENFASAHARETLQLKALSKRKQWLVKAGPPLAWTAKLAGVLVTCVVVVLRHKVLDMLMKKGVVSQETVIAALTMFLLTKEILEALKKGKEYLEMIRFYVKFWERDK